MIQIGPILLELNLTLLLLSMTQTNVPKLEYLTPFSMYNVQVSNVPDQTAVVTWN